jgi:hypothetical protein
MLNTRIKITKMCPVHLENFGVTVFPSPNIYQPSNWLTPWNSALLEKPSVVQLLKNFLSVYGTPRCITIFTRTLSWPTIETDQNGDSRSPDRMERVLGSDLVCYCNWLRLRVSVKQELINPIQTPLLLVTTINTWQYYSPTYILVFLVVSFLLAFPPISYMHSSSPQFVLYVMPISSSLASSL